MKMYCQLLSRKLIKMLKMLFLYFADNIFTIYIKIYPRSESSQQQERERNVSKQQQTQQETGAVLEKQREAVSKSKDSKQ